MTLPQERKYKKDRASKYPDSTIDAALKTLVICGGNATEAAKVVKTKLPKGSPVPTAETINAWRREVFPTEYAKMESEMHDHRARRAAAQSEAIIIMSSAEAQRALESLQQVDYGELKPVERSKIVENLSRVAAIHNEKISAPIRGRPTVNVSITDVRAAIRSAKSLPGIQVVDAEVVEEKELSQHTQKESEKE